MDISQVAAGSIVVGVDGSPWSDRALDWAVDQASLEQRPLTLVHAVSAMGAQSLGAIARSGPDQVRIPDESRTDLRTPLDDAVARARDRGFAGVVHDCLSVSDPRSVLLDLGMHAAMVVVGSRGRGPIATLLLGSVSVSVSRHAACPVVIRRTDGPTPAVHRILVGVDGTQHSLPAIEFAFRMASSRQSTLTVLHCFWTADPVTKWQAEAPAPDLSAERALVSESMAGMAEKFPEVEVTLQLVADVADHQLITASPDYDLVVVGHRPIGHLGELIHDSVAAAVLEHAEGSVAVVPWQARPSTPVADA